MQKASEPQRRVSFGPFEVDLLTAELRKNGVRIKLQAQPFRVLERLLEHPGGLVTREELKARLWPTDNFEDFDYRLNKAINKLREALNDSAPNPRYIETVARRVIVSLAISSHPTKLSPTSRRRGSLGSKGRDHRTSGSFGTAQAGSTDFVVADRRWSPFVRCRWAVCLEIAVGDQAVENSIVGRPALRKSFERRLAGLFRGRHDG